MDQDRRAGALPDRERLVDGLEEARAFASHVGRIEAASLRHHAGQRDDLGGRGETSR